MNNAANAATECVIDGRSFELTAKPGLELLKADLERRGFLPEVYMGHSPAPTARHKARTCLVYRVAKTGEFVV